MSDVAQGPGWWQASDGRWYPPELLAQALGQVEAPAQGAPLAPGPLATGAAPATGPPTGTAQPAPTQAGAGAPAYAWPGYPAYPFWRRERILGTLLVVLGLAGLVWGVGEVFAALALNGSPLYPHDEQIGAWIVAAGILLASLVTVAIGLVYRRP